MRLGVLAAAYGFIAGAVAALVLWLMEAVRHLIWSGPDARWYVFGAIMLGGALIAALRHLHEGETLAEQMAELRAPGAQMRRNAALMAAMAVIAVGFGGAVGPEAGILAVIAEMAALIGFLLARTATEQRILAEAGAAGALGGLYGSPPAGAIVAQEHPEVPRWQLYIAGVVGLLGFLLVAGRIMPDQPLQVALPPHEPSGDGSDMIRALMPAVFGAAAGLAFVLLLPRLQTLLARCGGVMVQTLIGTAIFAALAATWPILRFSGHHEMEALLHWGADAGFASLAGLALLKALVLAVCLAAGWRGGSAFPLIFIGAAAGGAALWFAPGTPATVALVAGITAALATGMGKPLGAILLAALILGLPAVGPLCIGAAVGWAAAQLAPAAKLH